MTEQETIQNDAEFQLELSKHESEKPCHIHWDVPLKIWIEGCYSSWSTYKETYGRGRITSPIYRSCPKCSEDSIIQRLRRAGVPDVLVGCKFDNWTPSNKSEEQHLETVKEFADKRRGFLVLLGPVGVGKSHLAVAVMRRFRFGSFVKQSTLLRQLRETYRDKTAVDPTKDSQNSEILTLDEMGISAGGKDEWPMLSEILDYRYTHLLPTIITSNLTWDQLRDVIGDRLSDRMKESAHAILVFSGASHRADRRNIYFETKALPPLPREDGVRL